METRPRAQIPDTPGLARRQLLQTLGFWHRVQVSVGIEKPNDPLRPLKRLVQWLPTTFSRVKQLSVIRLER